MFDIKSSPEAKYAKLIHFTLLSFFDVQDKNFDKLTKKFVTNIYGTPKGEIRTQILLRDLQQSIPDMTNKSLRILDAGGGFGYLSQILAAQGHQITLCDISAEMLQLAQKQIVDSKIALDIKLLHKSIQQLDVEELGQFDLVLCHAVAEWLTDAKNTLACLLPLIKDNGYFSLMFYNLEAMRFHALISGNFDYVKADFKVKKKVRLTPTHPLLMADVETWFTDWGFSIENRSGIRVIHDYLKNSQPADFNYKKLLEMELEYSQRQPFLQLGRYIHFIGRKKT